MLTLREYLVYLEENIELALVNAGEEIAKEIRDNLQQAKNLPDYMLEEPVVNGWFSSLEILQEEDSEP